MVCLKSPIPLYCRVFLIDTIIYCFFYSMYNFQRQFKPCFTDSLLFLYNYIEYIYHYIDKKYESILNSNILVFLIALNCSWLVLNRTATTFIFKHECWLDTELVLPQYENKIVDNRGRRSK